MQFLRRPLESTGWLMAGLSLVFGVLMLVDPRLIEGAPAWLKPLKFAVSTGIYGVTLAWILRFLPAWPRLVSAPMPSLSLINRSSLRKSSYVSGGCRLCLAKMSRRYASTA